MRSVVTGFEKPEILEPSEKKLIRRYRRAVYARPLLSALEKLYCLKRRREDPQARRLLVHHYLPLAYRIARQVKGGSLLQKIETGNRAIMESLDHLDLRPEDDLDFLISRQIHSALKAIPR